jgi:hypothetical protein
LGLRLMTLLKWPNRPKSKPLGAGRRPSVADRPIPGLGGCEILEVKLPFTWRLLDFNVNSPIAKG